MLDECIILKEYISQEDYKKLSQLEDICRSNDKANLKLELDYRMSTRRNDEMGLKQINEFFYYIGNTIATYMNISSFGGSNIGEINGMTHPDFRRKGLFKKLLELATDECKKRNFNKILLLSDGNSESGIKFISSVNGEYDFSEYRMKCEKRNDWETPNSVKLIKADKLYEKEIARQDAIYFNSSNETEYIPEYEELKNTYMVVLNEKVIGKISIDCDESSAFICGFGILPDFRGKGYGKATLKEALRLINQKSINNIELDVECKNNTALNLYKSCGFEEQSVMDYYNYKLH